MKTAYKLTDLPDPYREIFLTGVIPANQEVTFYPFAHNNGRFALLVLLVGLPFFVILPMALLYGTFGVLLNPTTRAGLEPLLFEPDSVSVWIMLVGALCINGILPFLMLFVGFKMIYTLFHGLRAARREEAGFYHYGLLLDQQNLVYRGNYVLNSAECVLLPRAAIIETEITTRRNNKRTPRDYLIHYQNDDQTEEETLTIPLKDFKTPDQKSLGELINGWRL